MDIDTHRKTLEALQVKLKADMEAKAREEEREEEREAILQAMFSAVDNLIQHAETLERDLKWILAIPRGYRALRERVKRLFSYRRVVRTGEVLGAAGSGKVLGAAGLVVGFIAGVQKLGGWHQVFDWLSKIFTGQ